MIPRIDNRMYTNLMLTVIAAVLVAGAAQQFGVTFTGDAQAQTRRTVPSLDQTATGVVIDSNIPQTQDVAVAAATSEVAASNREIAAAILELAEAVRTGTASLRGAITAAPAASPATPASATPAERPTVQVGP